MPLLSIPRELLLDIIGYVAASTPQPATPASLGGLQQLAQTCAVLRSLSVTFIYSSVTLHREARQLGSLVIDYPHIATSIRRLKIEAPSLWSNDSHYFLRRILEHCTKLRELVLERSLGSSGLRTGFEDGLLEYLPMSSRQSIKTIVFHGLPLGGLLAHFKRILDGDFSSLHTLKMQSCDVCNPYDVRRHRDEQTLLMKDLLTHANAEPPSALKSIRSFLFDAPFPYRLAEETDVGACFAKSMPNLESLFMITSSDVIYGALSAYTDLGSRLTELTLTASYPSSSPGPRLNPQRDNQQRNHFCDTILKLSRNLTKLVIFGTPEMRICHTLFAPNPDRSADRTENWPNLEILNVRCLLGCEGIKPDILQSGLERLTINLPGAILFMEGRFRETLISWNTRASDVNSYGEPLENDFIASLDAFERLNPSPASPQSLSDEGDNNNNGDPENWNLEQISLSDYEEDIAPWIYDY